MILRVLLILTIYSISTAQAEVLSYKVKAILVQDDNAVSKEYLDLVLDNVRERFIRDLNVRLRIRTSVDSRLVHSDFLALNSRYDEFEAWSKILKKRKVSRRTITVVIIPPSYYQDQDYSWGFTTWFCMAVVRVTNCAGEDRFNQSWVAVSHELAHALGANHTSSIRKNSIMHSNALTYADNDLRFLSSTKREIQDFIKIAKG